MARLATEITLTARNRPGQLAAIGRSLADAGVNIAAISANAAGRDGTIRLLFANEDSAAARRALEAAGHRIGRTRARTDLLPQIRIRPRRLWRGRGQRPRRAHEVIAADAFGRTGRVGVRTLVPGQQLRTRHFVRVVRMPQARVGPAHASAEGGLAGQRRYRTELERERSGGARVADAVARSSRVEPLARYTRDRWPRSAGRAQLVAWPEPTS